MTRGDCGLRILRHVPVEDTARNQIEPVSHAALLTNLPTTSCTFLRFNPTPITNAFKIVPPSLSQELIDKIIDQSSGTAGSVKNHCFKKGTLAFVSRVARAWRERSQKHLFSVIKFRIPSSVNVTEANLDELGLVFSLTRDLDIDGWEILSQFDPVTIAFLHRFRNLESLFLTHWNSRWFNTEQLSPLFPSIWRNRDRPQAGGGRDEPRVIDLPRINVSAIACSPDLYQHILQ